jgi:hypothetical protein
MNPPTIHLHEALIRLAKGVVTAWEKWLEAMKSK